MSLPENMTDVEKAQLEKLGETVDAEVAARLAAQNQRTLGSLIVIILGVIAVIVMIVVGVASKTASAASFKELISSVQPGTVVVAVIAGLTGVGAGIGLKDKR